MSEIKVGDTVKFRASGAANHYHDAVGVVFRVVTRETGTLVSIHEDQGNGKVKTFVRYAESVIVTETRKAEVSA